MAALAIVAGILAVLSLEAHPFAASHGWTTLSSTTKWRTRTCRQLRCAVAALLMVATALPAAAQADLAPGSFVFDGSGVTALTTAPGGSVYAGGDFTGEFTPTGGGLVLPTSGNGLPNPSSFPIVAGSVAAVTPDGSGGWFIGGTFSSVGGAPRQNLAHVLASGSVDPNWNPGAPGQVDALAISGSTLYVGGYFATVGGQPRSDLAAVDASTGAVTSWNPAPDSGVIAIAVSGSTVYVGGYFANVGGQARSGLAAVDATTGNTTAWNPNPDSTVGALALSGSTLYVGGDFATIGGQSRNGLAAISTSTGSASGWNPNPDNVVTSMVVSGSTIYVGGYFANIGGQARSGLAAIDATTGNATSWNPNPGGSQAGVSTLALAGSSLFVGGSFTSIGGQPRRYAAGVDITTGNATAWDPGPDSTVNAIVVSGSLAYVGGGFNGANPQLGTIGGVAKFNPDGSLNTSFSPAWQLVTGHHVQQQVTSLVATGSTVYVGGQFLGITGRAGEDLAALDANTGNTTSWDPNPQGGNYLVFSLALSGSTVYVGGSFTTIGGQSRTNLAAVDANTGNATGWNPSLDGDVTAVAVSGSTVYAGGYFSHIGGQSRNWLGAVDTTTGSPTGWNPNPDGPPYALATSGSTVYVAGGFTTIAGQSRSGLAAIDATTGNATSWNPNPTSSPSIVMPSGSSVYVGGTFTSVGGQPRNGLAVVDATTGNATSFNPDPDTGATALAISGPIVYVAGPNFIGTQYTGGLAEIGAVATPPPSNSSPPTISGATTQGQTLSETHGAWTNSPTSYHYQWERCTSTGTSCSAITGATSQTYTLTTNDIGHTIRVQETASNAGGSSTPATSATTGVVQPMIQPPTSPSNNTPPVISGGTTVGQTLTSSTGAWSGTPPLAYHIQWQRCRPGCSNIAGANGSSYKLTASDIGTRIRALITATNIAGSGQATSSLVGPIAAAGPTGAQIRGLLAAALALHGKAARIGQILKHGGYVLSLRVPAPGKLVISWYYKPRHGKKVLVASATIVFHNKGTFKIRIVLTGKGRKLLKGAKHLKLNATTSYSPTGARTTTHSKTLKLSS
jgi:trimeric autotransporter adhesin